MQSSAIPPFHVPNAPGCSVLIVMKSPHSFSLGFNSSDYLCRNTRETCKRLVQWCPSAVVWHKNTRGGAPTFSVTLSLPLSLARSPALSLSLSLTHTHTHTHSKKGGEIYYCSVRTYRAFSQEDRYSQRVRALVTAHHASVTLHHTSVTAQTSHRPPCVSPRPFSSSVSP